MDLPLSLRTALEEGTCVVFVGAGVAHNSTNSTGQRGPTGTELAGLLCNEFGVSPVLDDLAIAAELVQLRHGRQELESYLSEQLADLEPDANMQWLMNRRWRAIFTTNYDRMIEQCFHRSPSPAALPLSISSARDFRLPVDGEVAIHHLHGYLFSDEKNLLITTRDYSRFRETRRMLFECLRQHFAASTILYIGYSNSNPNWASVLDEIQREFEPVQLPESYRLAPDTAAYEREILAAQSVTTLDGTLDDFVAAARVVLRQPDPPNAGAAPSSVPSDLRAVYETNPVGTNRLLSSWEFVNQADFSEPPNLAGFLAGDPPNWAAIQGNRYFARDVESELLDMGLDFATSEKRRATAVLVTGSAGYGISTTLRATAVSLVKEQAGPVLFLRPGRELLDGDVLFASRELEGRPFFFIDNASEHGDPLSRALALLRDRRQEGLFFLGERTNEWAQAAPRLSPTTVEIEALSEEEVDRVIDFLEREGSLGELANVSRELQRSTILVRHKQQLLVLMMELTHGAGFDAIIEDEYRGIGSETGRAAYRYVCALHRHRALVRDLVLAEVLSVPVSDLYELTSRELSGVVRWDEIDRYGPVNGARSRHHVIAESVWQRLMGSSERRQVLLDVIRRLNLSHHADRVAFDSLVRSDESVDSLSSLDDRVEFFESAIRKDPRSPFIRQHYARMLLRAERLELALGQITEAIESRGRGTGRVLFHTKGLVLAAMALNTSSDEIALRRLAQAEQAFRECIAIDARDDYAYVGLASLYFDWARRRAGTTARADYLRQSEEVIAEGLGRVRDQESLYVASSRLAEYLGDEPLAVSELESAVAASPGGVYARYLLGREYLRLRRYEAAKDALQPVVEGNPEDWRALMVYAAALFGLGSTSAECVGVLRLAGPKARRDARYVAHLGGHLWLGGRYSDAEDVFEEARRHFTSPRDKRTVHMEAKSEDGASVAARSDSGCKGDLRLRPLAGQARCSRPRHKVPGSGALRRFRD